MIRCNTAIIAGNLTRDIELRYTASQRAVASFNIAVNRSVKQSDGSYKDVADFVPVQAWGRTAENCEKYLKKGDNILVEGRIQTRNYETSSGEKRYVTEVVAESVQFPSRKENQGGGYGYQGYQQPAQNFGAQPQSRRNDWPPQEGNAQFSAPPPSGTFPADNGEEASIPF